jgi:hypothetical protein
LQCWNNKGDKAEQFIGKKGTCKLREQGNMGNLGVGGGGGGGGGGTREYDESFCKVYNTVRVSQEFLGYLVPIENIPCTKAKNLTWKMGEQESMVWGPMEQRKTFKVNTRTQTPWKILYRNKISLTLNENT